MTDNLMRYDVWSLFWVSGFFFTFFIVELKDRNPKATISLVQSVIFAALGYWVQTR